ncbi:hypothetical protein AMTRI_Chr11g97070 [Amborella trichopoda]|uniref:Prolamin-like domain-containing protein n=1 Tax=Amborella trichopoda TaxID=13333 RepID=U5CXW1_AMBTC|nr:hypothetical protein AMTR_s00054p00163700 [Amborella trichopoda]
MRSKQLLVVVLLVAMLQEVVVLAMPQLPSSSSSDCFGSLKGIAGCMKSVPDFFTNSGTFPTPDCCKDILQIGEGCWAGFIALNQAVIVELSFRLWG